MASGVESYWLVRFVFQRGLALIYLLAFLVAANQFRPLAGEDGLLPIEEYVERASFAERPSLFYFVMRAMHKYGAEATLAAAGLPVPDAYWPSLIKPSITAIIPSMDGPFTSPRSGRTATGWHSWT